MDREGMTAADHADGLAAAVQIAQFGMILLVELKLPSATGGEPTRQTEAGRNN
jgi:hypothetical protein